MAISTNQKPTIYRNLYENTGPQFIMLITYDCKHFNPFHWNTFYSNNLSIDLTVYTCQRAYEQELLVLSEAYSSYSTLNTMQFKFDNAYSSAQ